MEPELNAARNSAIEVIIASDSFAANPLCAIPRGGGTC
jgi:hypothetical protein